MQKHELAVAGLFTGPNPNKAPEGALLIADNVMSVRPDLLEYRPGFERAFTDLDVEDNFPEALIPFDEDVLVYSDSAAGDAKRLDWADSALQVTGLPSSDRLALHSFSPPRGAQARKNLYLSGAQGTYKLTGSADTVVSRAGLLRPSIKDLLSATAGTAIADGQSYSHRFLIRTRDANDVIVRSPPTASYPLSNATGSTRDPKYTLWLPPGTIAGDVVEAYRTRSRTGTDAATRTAVGAEFALAVEHRVTAADLSAGYCTISDPTPDNELCAALYTNPSRDGELKANDIPPSATDLALFAGCLWYANTRPQQRLVRTLVDVSTDNGLVYVQKTGITITSGSPTITGFADTDEIHVGMAIGDSSTTPTVAAQFAGTARVISKTSTTVTMSSNATGNAAAVGRWFFDVIRVAMGASAIASGVPETDIEVYPGPSTSYAGGISQFFKDSTPGTTVDNIMFAINALQGNLGTPRVTAVAFGEDAFSTPPGALLLEEAGVGSFGAGSSLFVNLEFACSSPGAFADQPTMTLLAGAIESSSYFSYSEGTWDERNALRYSKPDEPEHVPYTNVLRVGSAKAHILRIVPLQNALLVFKEDGVFVVTGYAPDGWSVSVRDGKTRLLCAMAVDAIDNEAYAWTDRGMVAVSETGIRAVSEPVVGMGDTAGELKILRQHFKVGIDPPKGCFLVTWPTRALVCLAVPAAAESDYSERWWVYSIATATWSRFILTSRCAAFDEASQRLYAESGKNDWFEIRGERTGFSMEDSCDDEHAFVVVTTPSASTFTVELATGDRWVPRVGDLVYQDGDAVRVESVELDGDEWTVTTEASHGFSDDETATAIECIEAIVAWRPMTAGSPKRGMLWREGCFGFREVDFHDEDLDVPPWRVFLGATTDREATVTEMEIEIDPDEAAKPTVFARGGVSRAVARCSQLFPRMRILDRVRWHLSQFTIEIEGAQAGRVKR